MFGGGAVFSVGSTPQIVQGEAPKLAAQITPIEGVNPDDAGELSISQRVTVLPISGELGLLTDGVLNPTSGFVSEDTLPSNAAVPCSVVFNTAPFHGWDAVITPLNPFPVPPNSAAPVAQQITIWPTQTIDIFDLHDNMSVDDGGNLLPVRGSTAIRYGATSGATAKTVAQMEALVNTSTLYQVTGPDSAHATQLLFPGLSGAADYTPGDVSIPDFGQGLITFPTQGGTVYVPDFARRVRVVLTVLDTRFGGLNYRVPVTGDPACQLVWYDDQGDVVEGAFQSTETGFSAPPVWHPIPARAVMLGIYGGNADATFTALVNWRLSP